MAARCAPHIRAWLEYQQGVTVHRHRSSGQLMIQLHLLAGEVSYSHAATVTGGSKVSASIPTVLAVAADPWELQG